MKLSEPPFLSFIARFVDAVATEALTQELRQTRRQRSLRLAAFEFDAPEVARDPEPVAQRIPEAAQAA